MCKERRGLGSGFNRWNTMEHKSHPARTRDIFHHNSDAIAS